jgi:hypothetical protein
MKTAREYYGDKLSKNMTRTPEKYLICQNVPIARTGWQDYQGGDLPAVFNELPGRHIRVYRSPEEVFAPETIASFEGKPVTNTHPTDNLDLMTAPMTSRGHAQNIRREGDFLIADLVITDAGLINEIESTFKRGVSCGYDCSWHNIGDGKYEQREIIGNHVAIVRNGRAGPRVAIQDSQNEGGKKRMKITQRMLTALGFKHFAQDAEPDEIAAAMDAMKEEEPDEKTVAKEAKDEELHSEKNEEKFFKEIISRLEALENKGADKKAKDELSELEKEMTNEAADEKEPEEEEKEETKDCNSKAKDEDDDKKKGVADAALTKIVHDMSPIIRAIPDKKIREDVTKKFVASVRDARGEEEPRFSYAEIMKTVNSNKAKAAQDSTDKNNMTAAADKAAQAWKAAGQTMGGKN